jgi:two-component system response regulator MprA/two-component system response regulator TrcR
MSTRTKTRVLVVEDDASISRLLQLELDHRGFEVFCIADGSSALQSIEMLRPNVVILDILLPGLDGEHILALIRRSHARLPVIMLTARDTARDKIRNLGAGADDYLTKPFNIDELEARIRALLRRVEGDTVVRIGDLDVNMTTQEVRRGDQRINLTSREYDLLEYLARNARRVLSRDMILDRVWQHTPDVDPNVLDVYIGYLRKKIERPGQPRLIQTVRGMGFALREG